jgi:hypothetical protein
MKHAIRRTVLFETEGVQNLGRTVRLVCRAAAEYRVQKVLVFTSHGDGALELRKKLGNDTAIIAVTFPWQMTAKPAKDIVYIGLPSAERRADLAASGIRVVQGAMPFRALGAEEADIFRGIISAFDVFGGSTKLCVQAALMACDAGLLDAGDRCITMTNDTAVVLRAGHSFNFLRNTSTFAIEQFICKPQFYQITRGSRELAIARQFQGITIEPDSPAPALPSSKESQEPPTEN